MREEGALGPAVTLSRPGDLRGDRPLRFECVGGSTGASSRSRTLLWLFGRG